MSAPAVAVPTADGLAASAARFACGLARDGLPTAVGAHARSTLLYNLVCAVTAGESRWTTPEVTDHLRTALFVARQFLPIEYEIDGGVGNDTITLATGLTAAMSVDLGDGKNTLALNAGGNTGTVSNISTLIGGPGANTITLGTAIANGSIDLGAGSDTLRAVTHVSDTGSTT